MPTVLMWQELKRYKLFVFRSLAIWKSSTKCWKKLVQTEAYKVFAQIYEVERGRGMLEPSGKFVNSSAMCVEWRLRHDSFHRRNHTHTLTHTVRDFECVELQPAFRWNNCVYHVKTLSCQYDAVRLRCLTYEQIIISLPRCVLPNENTQQTNVRSNREQKTCAKFSS